MSLVELIIQSFAKGSVRVLPPGIDVINTCYQPQRTRMTHVVDPETPKQESGRNCRVDTSNNTQTYHMIRLPVSDTDFAGFVSKDKFLYELSYIDCYRFLQNFRSKIHTDIPKCGMSEQVD